MATISIVGAFSAENDVMTFEVTLSEPVGDAVTVDFRGVSGTALSATDFSSYFNPSDGKLVFAAGETTKTLTFLARTDSIDELDEAFFVELSNPVGADFGGAQSLRAVGWALDNDGPGANRALAVADAIVVERDGDAAEFVLSVSSAFATDTTFSYATFDGSATAGSDFVARTGTVTFFAGQTEARVRVDLIDGEGPEAAETFGLRVTGAGGVAGAVGTATILDAEARRPVLSIEGARALENDVMTFTVRLSEPATDAVTVDFRGVTGGALSAADFSSYFNPSDGRLVFAAGETTKTLTFLARTDSLDEIDEAFSVELSNPVGATFGGDAQSLRSVGWALDNDGPGGNRALAVSDSIVVERDGNVAEFVLSLSNPFATDTTFSYATFDGSAEAGSDYVAHSGTVTFFAGQTEARVRVDLLDGEGSEAAESFGLSVTGNGGVAGAVGAATILDVEARRPIVSVEGARALENDVMTFTVRLSEAASDAVTVDFRGVSGTALDGLDFSSYFNPSDGMLVFEAGETTKTLTFLARTDSLDEIDEAFSLELSNAVGADFGGGRQSLRAVGWSLDNDGPFNNRSIFVSSPTVSERDGDGGGRAIFDISLSQASTERLTFRYETIAGTATSRSDFRPASGEVVFEPGQTTAQVSVALRTDAIVEASETFSLRIVTPFPSAIAGAQTSAFGVATIRDGSYTGTNRADLLEGSSGADAMIGGRGDDVYVVNARGDLVVETPTGGEDTVRSSIDYALAENAENLTLTGARDIDGYGNDLANEIAGNAGANRLAGGRGADAIAGGRGSDVLSGGRGLDQLTGGRGEDVFVFRSEIETGRGRRADSIRDFERGDDVIDLGAIDAVARSARDQAFDFVGGRDFSGRAGELRFENGRLAGDVDGDGSSDFEIRIAGVARMADGDFVL